jgi:hypothetical protein
MKITKRDSIIPLDLVGAMPDPLKNPGNYESLAEVEEDIGILDHQGRRYARLLYLNRAMNPEWKV